MDKPQSVQDILKCNEYAMLADVIWREARGEPLEGQIAVGEVVLERVADKRWPNHVDQVVLQPWQFSAYNDNDPNSAKRPDRTDPAYLKCCQAAVDAFNSFTSFSQGANHYLNPEVVKQTAGKLPAWYREDRVTARIGRHVFLKL